VDAAAAAAAATQAHKALQGQAAKLPAPAVDLLHLYLVHPVTVAAALSYHPRRCLHLDLDRLAVVAAAAVATPSAHLHPAL